MSKHFRQLKVKEVKKETSEAVSIIFDVTPESDSDFNYKAGQYLTIKANVNGEDIRRSYSLSSSPKTNEELKVTSKMVENGRMSHYLYNQVNVGDFLEVMLPEGNFTIDFNSNHVKSYVLFAAGSGITPIISLIKTILVSEPQSTVQLIYGNRTRESIIFYEELNELSLEYGERLFVEHILSQGKVEGGREFSRIDKVIVDSIVQKAKSSTTPSEFFVCGPEAMIKETHETLKTNGISKENIHIEYFTNSNVDKGPEISYEGEVNEVTAILDEEEHRLVLEDGETILEAADRMGIDPPYSCQSGVCTSCKALVKQGEVEMGETFGLDDEEIEEGFILTCCSRPKTSGVVISWDEI